jgi:hypothetical protein
LPGREPEGVLTICTPIENVTVPGELLSASSSAAKRGTRTQRYCLRLGLADDLF